MKVEIVDYTPFHAIDPDRVERYLESKNWLKRRSLPNDVSIWDLDDSEGRRRFRLWLPEASDLADFPQAMGRVVKTLAHAEDRSELQVFEDLNTAAIGDVVRFRTYDRLNRESSSLNLEDGVGLIEQGKDLVTSAAMSEHHAREVHPSRRSNTVIDFIENMRLGQTENGSFTIKFISPVEIVSSENRDPIELPVAGIEAQPFSRRAITRLVTSLQTLKDIGQESERRGRFRFEPFLENVTGGISANLCEAVANVRRSQSYRPLIVSVTWSYALQQTQVVSEPEIEFPVSYMQYYVAAAERFRQKNPDERAVSGYVKILSRDHGESTGTISLVTVIDGQPRVVRIELAGDNYRAALQAHADDLFAIVEGTLVQRGMTYWLENPTDVQLMRTPPLPFSE